MLLKDPREALLTTLKVFAPSHVDALTLFRHTHNLLGKPFGTSNPPDPKVVDALADLFHEGLIGEDEPKGAGYWLIESPIAQSNKEVPCKVCQRKVGITDKSCWWCGNKPF